MRKSQIPNILTISRVLLIPFFVAAFYINDPTGRIIALSIFIISSVTDFFDGYLARKWKVESGLGKMLDPIADKLLISTALLMFIYTGKIHVIAALIILLRELFISGLREFLGQKNIVIHVSKLAKIKTSSQMIAIILLLLNFNYYGNIALWIAAILTFITGAEYLKKAFKKL